MTPDHDIKPGPITACHVCGSSELRTVIDLGHQPLCDSMVTETTLAEPEVTYPLRLLRCVECSLAQLDYVVPGDVVFHPEYPYRSGITAELVEYQTASAKSLAERHQLPKGSLVVDVGSNDGTMLAAFKQLGMRVLGVEPTNIAQLARQAGVDTLQEFFTEKLAEEIVRDYGQASLIVSTNTYAHIASLGEVVRGVARLLSDSGVFVTENHNLLDVLQKGQFDTIYHEHLRTYSLKSLLRLYSFYDFTLVHAERVSRYGGNLRAHAKKGQGHAVSANVMTLLEEEEEFGISTEKPYEAFRQRAEKSAEDLLKLTLGARSEGKSLVGISCPGRCVTLLNYAGITERLMPYIAEQPTSLKLGMYLPGKHIPIVDNSRLTDDQPDIAVLLAWHYADPIMKQWRERGLRSRFVVPLPDVSFIDD
jgi:SAM-dependent methyltransferase